MKIAVLDYGIGNLRSAQKALERVGADARLTSDHGEIDAADAVVLPGVGAFGACMEALRRSELDTAAVAAIGSGRPFLGVCVGMQMLYGSSEENPDVTGLGVFDRAVTLLPSGVKRPQMQWNRLSTEPEHPMFIGLDEPWVYFVHSYSAEPGPEVVATCEYGTEVVAAVARDNVWATQFHPEKSGLAGLAILQNFIRWANR